MIYLAMSVITENGNEHKYYYNMGIPVLVEDTEMEFFHHKMHFYNECIKDASTKGTIANTANIKIINFKDINKASQTDEPYIAIDPPKSHAINSMGDPNQEPAHL